MARYFTQTIKRNNQELIAGRISPDARDPPCRCHLIASVCPNGYPWTYVFYRSDPWPQIAELLSFLYSLKKPSNAKIFNVQAISKYLEWFCQNNFQFQISQLLLTKSIIPYFPITGIPNAVSRLGVNLGGKVQIKM